MTDRRPHWDDDLIKAVADVLEHDDYIYATTYAVIAAVEDWHEKFVMYGAFRVLAERAANADRLALTAEAAIARVRDVCDRIWDDARYAHKYGFLEVVREVRYALEGDSDE